METLRLEHVSVTYDGIRSAIEDISLQVMQGEIICIVGESGSGKSTLLHAVQGLLPRSAVVTGKISLFGRSLAELDQAERRRLRGEQIAMIFQDTGRYMNPITKIGRQYMSFLKLHLRGPEAELEALQERMLRKVNLTDTKRVLNSYPFELSGGMRQRVGIAMALSLGPKLLLADEPTSALDVTVQAQVVRELVQLCREAGTTIIIVTHNMGLAANISDRIGVMQGGHMVEWGTVHDVIRDPKSAYTKNLLGSIIELDDPQLF